MPTKITYTQQGDYLLPDLKLPEQPTVKIGIWGKRHLRYLEKHHPIIYTNLLTSCKLTAYLADIDKQAEDMFFRLLVGLSVATATTLYFQKHAATQTACVHLGLLGNSRI